MELHPAYPGWQLATEAVYMLTGNTVLWPPPLRQPKWWVLCFCTYEQAWRNQNHFPELKVTFGRENFKGVGGKQQQSREDWASLGAWNKLPEPRFGTTSEFSLKTADEPHTSCPSHCQCTPSVYLPPPLAAPAHPLLHLLRKNRKKGSRGGKC